MATFDSFGDVPGQIRVEGEQITLRFDRTGPNTGRVSWNIPPPAAGCTSETQAYCGIIITLDNEPATISTAPTDGTLYTSDPTGDRDLHAGDKIGTALVIGAFYEGVKKGTGEDFTTFFDISGLNSTTQYFIAGHAVDCTARYHRQGVFAYSQPLGNAGTDSTSATQTANLNGNVIGTDGTGLQLGTDYTLPITIDGNDYTITINGSDAQIYDDLIEAINNEIEKLPPDPSNPVPPNQSPVPPNQGTYYWNADEQTLYQWNGFEHVPVASGSPEQLVLVEPTDPTALAIGNLWYNPNTKEMNRWDGAAWQPVDVDDIFKYNKDLADVDNLTPNDYWYSSASPSSAYQWCGNVWCNKVLYEQTTDPVNGITLHCGIYWYNTSDMKLRQWNEIGSVWKEVNAIYWDKNPSVLDTGTVWFDDDDEILYEWNTPISGIFNRLDRGYQDVFLTASSPLGSHSLTDLALADGTYTDTVSVGGNAITVTITICNATEGQFGNVFAEINRQLTAGSPATPSALVEFRDNSNGNVVRLTSTNGSAPTIQAGGDLFSSLTDYDSLGVSTGGTVVTIGTEPTTTVAGQYWVDTENEEVYLRNGGNTGWDRVCSIFYNTDPTDRVSCGLWWNSDTDKLNVWDSVNTTWVEVERFFQDATDPSSDIVIEEGALWYNSNTETMSHWNGSSWEDVSFVASANDPTTPIEGNLWFNPNTGKWYERTGSPLAWSEVNPVESLVNPSSVTIPTGTFWFDTLNDGLFVWNGLNWISVSYSAQPLTPEKGEYWYDTSTNTLFIWNGTTWVTAPPLGTVVLDGGNLIFTATSEGSLSSIIVDDTGLLESLKLFDKLGLPCKGTDGLSGLPTYAQEGIGTDGSSDERRMFDDQIRRQLGYPTIDVELDKEHINLAIDFSLQELRRRSSSAYRRGFMKLNIVPGIQRYILNNSHPGYTQPDGSVVGYNRIVTVMGCFRVTSAFMTSAHGSGIFGQVVLQHLYNMGTFDLLSFHLVSEYIEQLEHLFASRLTFNWSETDRVLWLHQAFSHNETILMDVAVERTEQDLLTDRYTARWIERYALALSKSFLAQIRGKYATLPGAGGGITLNAADLQTQYTEEMEALIAEIDNYQVNNVEEYGLGCEFTIG